MLLFEAIRLAKKQLLNESYKDLERLYGDLSNMLNPEELKYAYNLFQTESGIKNIIKKELNLSLGSIEKAIIARYPQPLDFINSVFQAKDQLGKDKKIQVQKTQVGQQFKNELKENETDDFYIIPCRTFEQAHKAANSYTGNLEIMSRDKIKEIYDIDVPQPNHFYETDKSPAEFLEFMKSAPFFMAPTWCIAGGKNFWDMYKLDSKDGEPCKCYIIISKRYPNIRFCITKRVKETTQLIPSECDDKKCTFGPTEILKIDEFRDPWQIGGPEAIIPAKNMFCSINFINEITKNKIFKLLQPLQVILCKKTYEYEKITDGHTLFVGLDWQIFDKKLDHLEDGSAMFEYCENLTQFTSDLPNLTDGNSMFGRCKSLEQFTSDLSNLIIADNMFSSCENLRQFTSNLPNLTHARCMFDYCKSLEHFTSNLPNLTKANNMFWKCENLRQFTSNLPNLTNGNYMFNECTNLKQFTSNLPNLVSGEYMFNECTNLKQFTSQDLSNLTYGGKMFYNCIKLTQFTSDLPKLSEGSNMFYGCSLDEKSVLNILKTIPNQPKYNPDDFTSYHDLHIGNATNFKHSLQIAELLKTTVPIKRAVYGYKGWVIIVR